MKKIFLAGTLALAGMLTSCDKDEDEDVNATDEQFAMNVAMSNRAEINTGALAATKGSTAMVRNFGQLMVQHHTIAQTDLRNIANNEGVAFQDTVNAEQQALMTRLMSLNGYQFDTAYINSQVKAHQATILIFQSEISGGANPPLRGFATSNLPMIQMHYNTADSIRQQL